MHFIQKIPSKPSACGGVIVAVVIVNEAKFGIIVLAAPLDGLGDIAFRRDFAVGGVGVGRADVAGGAVHFADVFGQIPAVGVPGAVELDGQRTRGDGLGRVPGDEPEGRVRGAGEVDAGNLQVTTVDITLGRSCCYRPVCLLIIFLRM